MNAPIRFRNCANPEHTAFYVSAIDGKRIARIAGPYGSHEEAQNAVQEVRLRAELLDPRAHWWAWGTCSLPEHDGRRCPL